MNNNRYVHTRLTGCRLTGLCMGVSMLCHFKMPSEYFVKWIHEQREFRESRGLLRPVENQSLLEIGRHLTAHNTLGYYFSSSTSSIISALPTQPSVSHIRAPLLHSWSNPKESKEALQGRSLYGIF